MTVLGDIPVSHLAHFLTQAGGTTENPLSLLRHLPAAVEPDAATLGHLTECGLLSQPSVAMAAWCPAFRDMARTLNEPRCVLEIDVFGNERRDLKSWYLPAPETSDLDAQHVVGLELGEDIVGLTIGVSARGLATWALSFPFPEYVRAPYETEPLAFDAELTPEHAMAMALVLDALVLGDHPVTHLADLVRQVKAMKAGTAKRIGGYAFSLQLAGCADNLPDKRMLLRVLHEFEQRDWLARRGRRTWGATEGWDRSSFRMVGVARMVALMPQSDGSLAHRVVAFQGAQHGFGLRIERQENALSCVAVTPRAVERELQALAM